jgi:hypothetical protein
MFGSKPHRARREVPTNSVSASPLAMTSANLRRGAVAGWVSFLLLGLATLLVGNAVETITEGITREPPASTFLWLGFYGAIPAALISGVLTVVVGVPLAAVTAQLLRNVTHPLPRIVVTAIDGALVGLVAAFIVGLIFPMWWSAVEVLVLASAGALSAAVGWVWAWRSGRTTSWRRRR